MKIVESRVHSNGISGVYALEDGRSVYWSEGSCTTTYVMGTDGVRSVFQDDIHADENSKAFFAELVAAEEEALATDGIHREMTRIEEDIFEVVAQGGLDVLINELLRSGYGLRG